LFRFQLRYGKCKRHDDLDVVEEQESEINRNSRERNGDCSFASKLPHAGVSAIVWASGFRFDFDWVNLSIFDDSGEPVHRRGVTQFPGIYFLGLRWLYKRKSAFLLRAGSAEDAAYLADQVLARS
jgi:hypothetical protein